MHTLGLHHITAIAGAPGPNVAFYTNLLGLRLVKQTVNFDDPGTYHLYYGDRTGAPGTILTFFPYTNALPGTTTTGMIAATAFSSTPDGVTVWRDTLRDAGADVDEVTERFGQPVLAFRDPDGLPLEIVGDRDEDRALARFGAVSLGVMRPDTTARLLTDLFGYETVGEEGDRLRLRLPGDDPCTVDLVRNPHRARMRGGAGTYHHVAFRARDDDEQLAWRETLLAAGFQVTTVQDRQYFKSIYFREPNGVLFEVATDGPGFLRDETEADLGTHLKLPPWLEPNRTAIEATLPPLDAV